MNIQLNKNILSIFLFAAVLALLTACGGSSSGGTAATPPPTCDPATHFCDTSGVARDGCAPATHFCATTGVAKASCDSATYFCTTTGVAKAGCDSATYFCDTTGVAKAGCDGDTYFCDTSGVAKTGCAALGTHNCHTGLAHTFDTAGNIIVPAYDAPDKAATENADRTRYTTVVDGSTIADAVTKIQADVEYKETRNIAGKMSAADQIGAAYAYARGYTGEGVIVSQLGAPIDRDHTDLAGQLPTGYTADTCAGAVGGLAVDGTPGTCKPALKLSTYTAGIIAGESGNGGIQGIAYGAKIKPVSAITTSGATTNSVALTTAIAQASGMVDETACTGLDATAQMTADACKTAAVINNQWGRTAMAEYTGTVDGTAGTYRYFTPSTFATIVNPVDELSDNEKNAWKNAVIDADGNTNTEKAVLVFAQGNQGHNSFNGRVQLYNTSFMPQGEPVLWSTIETANGNPRNIGGLYTTLPDEVSEVGGKILTVIALDSDNVIWEFSNGCGDAKTYCLGAPGVNIKSAIPGIDTYEVASGTHLAAAHVSGAVAVLKSAFNHLTPAELVEVILATADDLGVPGVDDVYGHGALNLARATQPLGLMATATASGESLGDGITIDNSGITLPTSFGGALDGFSVGFTDDYKRAFIGNPSRITRTNAAFTLGDTIATWDSPELQSIALDSNSKMQFTNYDESEDAKDTLIFTHNLPNHTIGFSYNEESKTPDLNLADTGDDLHFQKIRPIASDLMQLNSTHKLGKAWNVKNAITSGEFDTGNRFNEAMANLNYTGENHNLTIGAGTLQEYGQFLGASGTGAYQLSDATSSQVTHLAVTQNLPRNSKVKLKYTGFKTEVDMRYNNFAKINDLTANEYQLTFAKQKIFGKNDSLNLELIQPFAVTDGNLQQSTVLGYTADGDYNNVTQNYTLKPETRRQQLRMTWQNQINPERKTKLFISMQYENNVNNLRDNEDSQILGGISTRF